jgi:hypothetical protein
MAVRGQLGLRAEISSLDDDIHAITSGVMTAEEAL